MTPKFLTNREAQKRIAELEALVAKGATNSASVRDIDSDEALVAHMRAERLKREAAPSTAAAREAVQARLDAGRAMLAAAEAKARAKAATAALKPAKAASKTPHLDRFNALKGGEATAYFREHQKLIRAEQTALNIEAKTGQVCTISATGTISRTSKI